MYSHLDGMFKYVFRCWKQISYPEQELSAIPWVKFLITWKDGRLIIEQHDDVIKWKHFPRYWLFVRGIHRSPVNYPHKGRWRVALMFTLISAGINGWVNNGEAGDLRRNRAHYDVIVMNYPRVHRGLIAFVINRMHWTCFDILKYIWQMCFPVHKWKGSMIVFNFVAPAESTNITCYV